MTAVAQLEPQTGHLRIRVDELEEEVRQLREQLVPPLAFPTKWRLAPPESAVLAFLYVRHPHVMCRERILAAVWGHHQNAPEDKILDLTIYRLRTKLQPHGIVIETHWGGGYSLSRKSLTILQCLFGDRRASWRNAMRD